MRPPGERRLKAASMATGSTSSSALTAARRAWNTRLAGWPPPAHGGGHGRAHHVGQSQRRVHRAGGDDGGRDAAGKAGLAVREEQAGQLLLAGLVEEPGRRACLGAVHAHVQRGVERGN